MAPDREPTDDRDGSCPECAAEHVFTSRQQRELLGALIGESQRAKRGGL